jgi:hypothetical protein
VQKREAVWLVLLMLAGGSMVAVADLTTSYVPLFFSWVAFLAIPFAFSAMERTRTGA